ncbi:MAG: SPL family radical SAM protein [Candidatus Njordarchaeia archaeon]
MSEILVKSLLNKHKKRDDWFLDDYSVNPYTGCSFNCLYCYVRGSKYGGFQPGGLAVKINAPEILERQLRRRARKKEYGIIAISTSTEPYQKIEEKYKVTKRILEIISKYRFPVHILTKSKLVLRDMQILREIDEKAILPKDLEGKLEHGAIINISISTLDQKISSIIEPGAPPPKERLETMKKFRREGFLAGISYVPTLPFISDSDEKLEEMIRVAKDYDAGFLFIGALTLYGSGPNDSKTLYFNFIKRHYPNLLPKYRKLFSQSFQPPKSYQNQLYKKAREISEKYGVKIGLYKELRR